MRRARFSGADEVEVFRCDGRRTPARQLVEDQFDRRGCAAADLGREYLRGAPKNLGVAIRDTYYQYG